jgi:hypothetical protein
VHLHGALLAANRLTNVGRPSQGRPSFLKKEAKFFGRAVALPALRSHPKNKSFLVLFFKKEHSSGKKL